MSELHSAYHESSHALVARALGRQVEAVAISPPICRLRPEKAATGRTDGGALFMGAQVRKQLERNGIILVAGPISLELVPPTEFVTEEGVNHAKSLGVGVITPRETLELKTAICERVATDQERAEQIAAILGAGDDWVASAWYRLLEENARRLLVAQGTKLDALAVALLEHRRIGGAALRRLFQTIEEKEET